MDKQISTMLAQYENGTINRRQLVAGIGSLVALVSSPSVLPAGEQEKPSEPTFKATGLNHIALQVTNVKRSRDFYIKHLGLSVRRDGGERSCFLDCGKHFVALFKSNKAQMDHYCYSIDNYDVDECETKLKAEGFDPRVVRPDNRIYFKDPDGLTVQLANTPK